MKGLGFSSTCVDFRGDCDSNLPGIMMIAVLVVAKKLKGLS